MSKTKPCPICKKPRSEEFAPFCSPRCRDRDDQIFLELAHAGGAITLYSRDRELLKLSRRTQRVAGFAVVRPEDFA